MRIFNAQLLISAFALHGPTIKFIMNDEAIAFFPVSQQHCDVKIGGLSYEDNYRGNSVAGLIVGGKAEIRFHKAFSDEKVSSLWQELRSLPECFSLPFGVVTYQGRALLTSPQ
jgi:hypothetical protein